MVEVRGELDLACGSLRLLREGKGEMERSDGDGDPATDPPRLWTGTYKPVGEPDMEAAAACETRGMATGLDIVDWHGRDMQQCKGDRIV